MSRPKGIPNRRTVEVAQTLSRLGCNPVELLARYALGEVPCARCNGSGKLTQRRNCPECQGTGREYVGIDHRLDATKALMPYVAPRRKAVEHSGPAGGPIQVRKSGVLVVPGVMDADAWQRAAKGEG